MCRYRLVIDGAKPVDCSATVTMTHATTDTNTTNQTRFIETPLAAAPITAAASANSSVCPTHHPASSAKLALLIE
jgi:hypothetical protein